MVGTGGASLSYGLLLLHHLLDERREQLLEKLPARVFAVLADLIERAAFEPLAAIESLRLYTVGVFFSTPVEIDKWGTSTTSSFFSAFLLSLGLNPASIFSQIETLRAIGRAGVGDMTAADIVMMFCLC